MLHAWLRRGDLDRLEASGLIGGLLARQGLAYGVDGDMDRLGCTHLALPDDLLNFQYDTVVVVRPALRFARVTSTTMPLQPRFEEDMLRFEQVAGGGPVKVVVVDVDGWALSQLGSAPDSALTTRDPFAGHTTRLPSRAEFRAAPTLNEPALRPGRPYDFVSSAAQEGAGGLPGPRREVESTE